MADARSEVFTFGTNLARALAARQVSVVQQYGTALRDYADGKVDAAEFGRHIVNLGYRESARVAEDVLSFGIEFYSTLFSAAGTKLSDAAIAPLRAVALRRAAGDRAGGAAASVRSAGPARAARKRSGRTRRARAKA